MKNTEAKAKVNLDESPLGALHKVLAHVRHVPPTQREEGRKQVRGEEERPPALLLSSPMDTRIRPAERNDA